LRSSSLSNRTIPARQIHAGELSVINSISGIEALSFLIRPLPAQGESLSSWRQRSGRANGYLWFPQNSRRYIGDLDRQPRTEELDWIARECQLPHDKLASLCIDQFSDLEIGKQVGGQLIRWVLCHKPEAGNDQSGSGFCPVCLKNDPTPYFRLSWRFAFITHCPIHQCRLLNSCPSCLRSCWPDSFASRHKYNALWNDLRHCPECGTDFGKITPVVDGKHEASQILWNRLLNKAPPEVAESRFSDEDYFRALWSICRLLSRQIKRFSSGREFEYLQAIVPFHIKGRTIERQSSEVRQQIVAGAMWLLDDWPDRFVKTCIEANISRSDFGAADNCSPKWFDEVVRDHLALTVNWITREDVKAAIGDLDAKGLPISKNALRRHLGISESWVINEILNQRRSATVEELVCLIRHYQTLISHTPPSRDQQRTLCRDFLILLYSAVSGENTETVCRMTKANIDHLLASVARWSKHDGEIGLIGSALIEMDDQYRHGIRPVFIVRCSTTIDSWFLSRFGNHMDGHSVRDRFAKIMKTLFDPKLWNSMDVFLTSLSGHIGAVRWPLNHKPPPS
jgi:hypothetical protein